MGRWLIEPGADLNALNGGRRGAGRRRVDSLGRWTRQAYGAAQFAIWKKF